jgi:hypothetical protein
MDILMTVFTFTLYEYIGEDFGIAIGHLEIGEIETETNFETQLCAKALECFGRVRRLADLKSVIIKPAYFTSCSYGNIKLNVAPPFGLFSAQIFPLCPLMISLQIANPNPVPPAPVLVLVL